MGDKCIFFASNGPQDLILGLFTVCPKSLNLSHIIVVTYLLYKVGQDFLDIHYGTIYYGSFSDICNVHATDLHLQLLM